MGKFVHDDSTSLTLMTSARKMQAADKGDIRTRHGLLPEIRQVGDGEFTFTRIYFDTLC
jgi:hypothetical protein